VALSWDVCIGLRVHSWNVVRQGQLVMRRCHAAAAEHQTKLMRRFADGPRTGLCRWQTTSGYCASMSSDSSAPVCTVIPGGGYSWRRPLRCATLAATNFVCLHRMRATNTPHPLSGHHLCAAPAVPSVPGG
jgi:hypothetical protein